MMRICIAVCPNRHTFNAMIDTKKAKGYFGINVKGQTRKLWKICPACGEKLTEKEPPPQDPKETVRD